MALRSSFSYDPFFCFFAITFQTFASRRLPLGARYASILSMRINGTSIVRKDNYYGGSFEMLSGYSN